jgi:hypothetical protein
MRGLQQKNWALPTDKVDTFSRCLAKSLKDTVARLFLGSLTTTVIQVLEAG